jgi:hypothetical protein
MRFSAGVPRTAGDMGIEEVLSTPHSPWQRAYVERVIGSIRRECLDHVIVFDERSLRRILSSYFNYFLRSRTHLSVEKDAPDPVRFNRNRLGRGIYRRLADCITATNDKHPEMTGTYSRFLVDLSICICPHVLRICSQARYSNCTAHGSHGRPVSAPHGVFVTDRQP